MQLKPTPESIHDLDAEGLMKLINFAMSKLSRMVDLDEIPVTDFGFIEDIFANVSNEALPAIRKHLNSEYGGHDSCDDARHWHPGR